MPFSTVYLDNVDRFGVGLRRSLMNDMSTTFKVADHVGHQDRRELSSLAHGANAEA